MKVKDLIRRLEEFNPESEVRIASEYGLPRVSGFGVMLVAGLFEPEKTGEVFIVRDERDGQWALLNEEQLKTIDNVWKDFELKGGYGE